MFSQQKIEAFLGRSFRWKPAWVTLAYVALLAGIVIGSHRFFAHVDPSLKVRLELSLDLLLIFISGGLLYLALSRVFHLSAFQATSLEVGEALPPFRTRYLTLIFVVLTLLVPLLCGLYIFMQTLYLERATFRQLDATARLSSHQIEDWLFERQTDVDELTNSTNFAELTARLQRGDRKHAAETLQRRLRAVLEAKKYRSIALLDPRGRPWLNEGQPTPLGDDVRALLPSAQANYNTRRSQVLMTLTADQQPVIALVTPLIRRQDERSLLSGFVVLTVNPQQSLIPLLQQWPTPTGSGESFLVAQSGSEVRFLTPLRFRSADPLRLHMPLAQSGLPAAEAVRTGKIGTFAGRDYRDMPVLSAFRPVAGTPWYLVAKIDRSEILVPIWQTASWIGAIALIAVIAITGILLILWRQREQAHELSLQTQRHKSDQLLHNFFNLPFIGMAIVSPESRRFIRFNDHACFLTGYSREELLEKTWRELTHPDDLEVSVAAIDKIRNGETDSVTFEQRIVRKNGSIAFVTNDVKCIRRPDGSIDYIVGTAQDITQRKHDEMALKIANVRLEKNHAELEEQNQNLRQAKAALEESRSRYVSLYEYAPVTYLTLSLDGNIQRINHTGTLLLGFPRDHFAGQAFASLLVNPECVRWPAFLRLSADGSEGHRDEFTLKHADGTSLHVSAESSLQPQDGDTPVIRMTLTDITKRRQAEAALRASIERYEAVTQSAIDAIVTTNSKGQIVAWNPRAEAIFGYTTDEIIGRPLEILLPSRFRTAHLAGMERILAGGEHHIVGRTIEISALRRDGSEFEIDLSITRWEVAEGVFYTGTIRDITRRKKTEQTLRMLSEAVRQSPEAIVITDTNGKIEYVNESFTAHTGYSRAEALGQNPRILNSGRTPPETFTAMWAALSQGESWKGEFRNRRKDGSLFVEFAVVAPIRQLDGTITHYVAVKEEITEKKRLGEELDNYRNHLEEVVEQRTAQLAEASQLAEAASMAKSIFLANMSHEIRTPLNAIIGLTHLLRSSEPTTRQIDRLDKIDTAAAHLLSLINNILDLSKIEANKMKLEETDFALNALLDNVRSMVTNQAREKRLPVLLDIDGVPPWLRGDPHAPAPGIAQLCRQCDQIHRAGTGHPARPADRRRRRTACWSASRSRTPASASRPKSSPVSSTLSSRRIRR